MLRFLGGSARSTFFQRSSMLAHTGSVVGQDGILRADWQSALLELAVISGRPIANRPQDAILPHKPLRFEGFEQALQSRSLVFCRQAEEALEN